jgi:TP901 family phage tail tape measure protein
MPLNRGGVRAWAVFGQIGVRGLGGAVNQLIAFNAAGRRVASMAHNIAGGISAITKTAIVAGITIGGLGVKAVSSFASFNDAMTQSQAIMGDLTSNQMARMEEAALRMGRTTRFSATEAAEGYFFLASAGLDAEQSIAALPQATAFAQAGMFNLAKATELATDAQSALGLTVDDAQENLQNLERVTDVLVGANTLANATVEEFANSLTNKVGPRLRALGKDIEEGVAALAAFADQGVKGRRAGQRLNIVLRDLPQVASENAEAFEELGIQVFDGNDNMRNLADIVEDMEEAFDGMSDKAQIAAIQQLGLNKRAADSLTILFGMSDAMRDYEKKLGDMGGMAQKVANKQLKSLTGQLDQLRGAFDRLMILVGKDLAKTVGQVANDLGNMIDNMDVDKVTSAIKRVFDIVLAGVQGTLNVIAGVLERPSIAFGGIIGLFLFGKSGLFLGGAIGAVFSKVREHMFDILNFIAKTRHLPGQLGEAGREAEAFLQEHAPGETMAKRFTEEANELAEKIDEKAEELREKGFSEEQIRSHLEPIVQQWMRIAEWARIAGDAQQDSLGDIKGLAPELTEGLRGAANAIGQVRESLRGEGMFSGIQPVDDKANEVETFAQLMGIPFPPEPFITNIIRRSIAGWQTGWQKIQFTDKVDVPTGLPLPSVDNVVKEVEDTVDEVEGPAASEGARIGERVGRSIVSGIIRGSQSMEDILKRVITQLIQFALFSSGGLIPTLGIFSPSKLMMGVGEQIGAGLVRGISDSQKSVTKAMRGLGSAVTRGQRRFIPRLPALGMVPTGLGTMAGRTMGGGRSRARAQAVSNFVPDNNMSMKLDVSELPAPKTPMGRERDRQWQRWLRNQSDIAKEEGYRFEGR